MSETPPPPPPVWQPFEDMRERIERNAEVFAGAFVVVSPGGKKIENLIISPDASESLFWASLKGMIDVRLSEIAAEEAAQGRGGFGRR